MYSNNFSNFGSSSGMSSQNQGFQRQYQPTGNVQSVYGQNANQGNQGNQGYGQNASSSYQMANYRGNQQGHDAGLRADSVNPSQMQSGGFGSSGGNFGSSNNYSSVNYGIRGNEQGGYNNVSSQFGFNSSPYSSMGQSGFGNQGFGSSFGQGTEAFHTANYRGNQPGHDAGLRADSMNPSQLGGSTSFGSSGMMNQGMGQSNFGQSGYSNQGATFGQGTEAFHTANYRGNQQGHDAGLRADSVSTAQQGGGAFSGVNFSSPSYGIRGRENVNSGLNNAASQFGFSQSIPYGSNQNQNSFN